MEDRFISSINYFITSITRQLPGIGKDG